MPEPHFLSPADISACSGKRVCLDTETTGLHWWKNKLIGLGVHCPDAQISGYIPTLDDEAITAVKAAVRTLAPGTVVIAHNAKFDFHFLEVIPDELGWRVIDTTDLVHLIDSRYRKSLKEAERVFLGDNSKRELVEEATQGRKKSMIWEWAVEKTAIYCENDARVEYQLAQELVPQIVQLSLWRLFEKDMRYLSVIMRAERRGVLADQEFMARSKATLETRVKVLEQNLYDSVGHEFNWRSPKQLSKALYEDLGIAKPKNPFADADGVDRSRFADGGKYKSTCTSTFLLTEKVHHPLGQLVSALREANLMISFLDKWQILSSDDGLFHANFNITGTRTGRLSSSEPNLQNVPSEVRGKFTQSVFSGDVTRTDEYNLRKAFVARPGMVFLSTDYKQMEIRMFGILSQDPFMVKALTSGMDIHLYIAKSVWGDCGDEMNKIHREWSKTISFGLIYGMTVGSLMYKLNMDRRRAKEVTDQYKGQFPRIDPWMKEIIHSVRNSGYVRYWSGRIWREDNPIDAYKGCNAVVQGGCADMLSIAALRVDEWLREQGDNYRIINFVHDELIAEVPEGDFHRCAKEVATIMQVPDLFDIPFATDPKMGRDYGDLMKEEEFIKQEEEDE